MAYSDIRAGVDWADKGYVCLGALPTDPLNKLPDPAYWSVLPTTISTAGTSTFAKSVLYSAELEFPVGITPHGYFRTGAAVSDVINLGTDLSSNHTFVTAVSSNYTLSVWQYLVPDYGAVYKVRGRHNGTGVWSDISLPYDPYIDGVHHTRNYLRRITIPFTTGANHDRIAVQITVGSTVTLFYVWGMLLTKDSEGTHPEYWNDGQSLSRQDDVTTYLKAANWQIGRTNWMEIMPSEGSAVLTLENSTKRFSPEISTSPIYGYMKSNRRMQIEYQSYGHTGIPDLQWYTMFNGWVEKYDVDTSVYRDREAKIVAYQGLRNLEKMRVSRRYYENGETDDWLYRGLRGGFKSINVGYKHATIGKSVVGSASVQPASAFLSVTNLYLYTTALPFYGHTWDENDTGETIMREWADFENGYVGLNRIGTFRVKARSQIAAASVDHTLSNTDVTDMTYQYGGEKWTAYRFTPEWWGAYGSYPSHVRYLSEWSEWTRVAAGGTAYVETPYWDMEGSDFSNGSIHYGQRTDQSAEGRRTDTGASVTVDGTVLYYIGQKWDDMRNPAIVTNWAYADRYYLKNPNAFEIEVRIRTRGVGFIQTTGTEMIVSDDAAALEYGYLEQDFANRMVVDQTTQTVFLNNKLRKRAVDYGWYSSVELAPKTPALASKIKSFDLMEKVTITNDPQTRDGANADHVIIGLAGSWTPQDLVYDLYLSPLI